MVQIKRNTIAVPLIASAGSALSCSKMGARSFMVLDCMGCREIRFYLSGSML